MHLNRKMIQGMTPYVLCLIITLLLTSCSLFGGSTPPKAGKAPANQQVYTSPMILLNGSADLTTLDPALAYDQNSLSAISMIYTGLVQLDDHMQVQPQLASSWSKSSDGLTWTFHLRPNLKFSDGTPLTSNDVAYSIDRALQPSTKSTVAPIYLGIIRDADKLLGGGITTLIGDSLQAVDQNTVKIATKTPAPYFLDMLANASSYVVEKSVIDKWGFQWTNHLGDNGGQGRDGPFVVNQPPGLSPGSPVLDQLLHHELQGPAVWQYQYPAGLRPGHRQNGHRKKCLEEHRHSDQPYHSAGHARLQSESHRARCHHFAERQSQRGAGAAATGA